MTKTVEEANGNKWIRMKPQKRDVVAFERAFNEYAQNIHVDFVSPTRRDSKDDPALSEKSTNPTEQAKLKLIATMSRVNIDVGLSVYILGKMRSRTYETSEVVQPKDVTFAEPLSDGSKNLQQLIENMKKGKFLESKDPVILHTTESDIGLISPTRIAETNPNKNQGSEIFKG